MNGLEVSPTQGGALLPRIIGLLTAVLASLAFAGVASAWSGAHWLPNTCGADLVAYGENGNWWIRVSDESGTLYENSAVPGDPYPLSSPLTVGGFSNDDGLHSVTYEVANAANHEDGYVKYTQRQANCLSGQSGPVGPAGPAATTPPAGTPGPAGPPGVTTTIVVHEPSDNCVSNRTYRFKVRKWYPNASGEGQGQLVVGVRASEPGITDVRVQKTKTGRFVVSWSTTGKVYHSHFPVQTMNIRASLATVKKVKQGTRSVFRVTSSKPKHIRLVWKYRPCTPKDGNLNDPSAAGQGATGGA